MKPNYSARTLFASVALATALGASLAPAGAAQTDLSPVPLGTASSTSVLPNLMFILDDSGSMARYWMPDNIDGSDTCKSYRLTTGSTTSSNCIVDSGTATIVPQAADGSYTDDVRFVPVPPSTRGMEWPAGPPAYANQFNTIYYNPQITYSPGKDAAGLDLPSFGSPWTTVNVNPYVSTNTVDLTTQYPEPVFCKNASDTPTDTSNCRRNGYQNNGTTLLTSFTYRSGSTPGDGTVGWPESTL